MELHHKVPSFLGGSEEKWNTEVITSKEHLDRHLVIAEEIGTQAAWASCNLILQRYDAPVELVEYIRKRLGQSISGKNNPNWNKTFSEETRQRISEKNKGPKHSEETRKLIGSYHKGKTLSKEHISAISGENHVKFRGYWNCGEFGKFASTYSAAKACNVTNSTIHYRCKSNNFNDWFFEPAKKSQDMR